MPGPAWVTIVLRPRIGTPDLGPGSLSAAGGRAYGAPEGGRCRPDPGAPLAPGSTSRSVGSGHDRDDLLPLLRLPGGEPARLALPGGRPDPRDRGAQRRQRRRPARPARRGYRGTGGAGRPDRRT